MEKNRTVIIALYSHIEAYPPSLNVLFHLSPMFDKVYVVIRNVMISSWDYPENVVLLPYGEFVEAEKVRLLSLRQKFFSLIGFGRYLRSQIKKYKPSLVLAYDPPAFSLLNLFSRKILKKLTPVVWYHNHDLMLEKELPKYSFMWILRKLELFYFHRATFFTLPTKGRLEHFPIHELRHSPVILPNFPSHHYYGKWSNRTSPPKGVLRLVFQGHVNRTNSIHKIVQVLNRKIDGNIIELHAAGSIEPSYREELLAIAHGLGVQDQLFIYGRLPYSQLPSLTSSCHIGLTIYGDHNITVKTISTASNKTFEYASVGLPVLYEKRSDLEQEFADYKWIHFADLDPESLENTLRKISGNYAFYAHEAKKDFSEKLNFEIGIIPFLQKIGEDIDRSISGMTMKKRGG